MIKAIIFDFDGVILESAAIKTSAFADVVCDYPKDQADEFVKYHMSHMGISRHVKFRYFIENILKEEYSEEKEKELARKFSDIVYNKVMVCDFVPGAKEFLERNYQKYACYIASGTPEDEMQSIIKGRGLERYFYNVYGTPAKKEEIIDIIMRDHNYSNEDVAFVGDANTDRKAAQSRDLLFIGRNTNENKTDFSDVSYKVNNLMEIEGILNPTFNERG